MADSLKTQATIMMIAGEASGDLHGARLVRELLRLRPGLRIFGIGGDRMIREGLDARHHMRDVSYLGFAEIVRHIPELRRIFRHYVRLLEHERPDTLVLIDYPGFNLRLAAEAKRLGIRVVYYISPQVWAWGSGRIKKMRRLIDVFAVILPFEENFFHGHGIDARFVGHPLLEVEEPETRREEFLRTFELEDAPILALLPGSREQEIRALLPVMVDAGLLLTGRAGSVPVIGAAPGISRDLYESLLPGRQSVRVLEDATHQLLRHARTAFVASGTATLEAALSSTPMVIVYRTNRVTFEIGKRIVKVKNIGLVNILAGRPIVPEILQTAITPESLAETMLPLLGETPARAEMIGELRRIRAMLGTPGASERVARMVLGEPVPDPQGISA